jgi:sec-independent protein translocase protein TatB|tara:strand:- start:33 stop:476 length:444 start_codon:yes stop_codon:yes gene_type:complete
MNGIGGIGGWELLLVAVIAMLVLGPEHMVKHAYRLGRWSRKLSRYWQEGVAAFREQLKDIEEEAVGDGADFPNLTELKELAAEIRLGDEAMGSVSPEAALDVATWTESETVVPAEGASEAASPDVTKTAAEKQTSYSAWRSPKKSKG